MVRRDSVGSADPPRSIFEIAFVDGADLVERGDGSRADRLGLGVVRTSVSRFRRMSFAVLLAGLNTLRPMAPGLTLFAFALVLVLLPRKWSSVAGSGIGLLAVVSSLAAG